MKKLLPVSNDIMNDAGVVCKEKFRIAENMEKTGYEILYYLCKAEEDEKVKKSCIAMKFDMTSMQKSIENEERTIQPVQK